MLSEGQMGFLRLRYCVPDTSVTVEVPVFNNALQAQATQAQGFG
jgi:hypothetical protein